LEQFEDEEKEINASCMVNKRSVSNTSNIIPTNNSVLSRKQNKRTVQTNLDVLDTEFHTKNNDLVKEFDAHYFENVRAYNSTAVVPRDISGIGVIS